MRKMVFASDESTWHVDTSILLMICCLDLDICRFCDPLTCVLLHLMSLCLRMPSTGASRTMGMGASEHELGRARQSATQGPIA
ncbi:hypothetical protein PVAP13_2KG251158 [Panicum virgatum]|uniref:Uncharacterized protein n=1 Tax=Panicum virgatum TaxID=38727 RepID=A0A8T0W1Z7_PANVG|nr:hypothetical protein PVAP13_2KG251158 [Panicum virgatum]